MLLPDSPTLAESRVCPDYHGGGLLNLIASCMGARGAQSPHPALAALPPADFCAARNVVLLLIDGLGYNYLMRHGRGGAIAARVRSRMTSVFPSTTASAITTSFTGLAPAEHGLTGWFTWFVEVGAIAAPLPFKPRGEGEPLARRGIDPAALYRGRPVFDALDAESFVVSFRQIIDSTYNRHFCGRAARLAYDDLAGFVARTEAAVKSGSARKFVYAYYPEFDTSAHRHGVDSPATAAVFAAIDAAYAELLQRLAGTDTALILTADHGFLDCPAENALELSACPGLEGLLARPLTGERRVAFCHVREGMKEEFARRASDWLGERADVIAGHVPLAQGWFGGGDLHPRIAERTGDFVLLMRDNHTVKDWLPGEPRHLHIGNHGGMSADEMYIPLVYANV